MTPAAELAFARLQFDCLSQAAPAHRPKHWALRLAALQRRITEIEARMEVPA